MKRIIRLTESDLTRIVKRVLNESSKETLKLKLYSDAGNLITNLDCYDMSLRGSLIDFKWKVAGGGGDYVYGATKGHGYPSKEQGKVIDGGLFIQEGHGMLKCEPQLRGEMAKIWSFSIITEKNSDPMKNKQANWDRAYLSKKGNYLVKKTFCDKYASTDTKQDDLDTGGDYA